MINFYKQQNKDQGSLTTPPAGPGAETSGAATGATTEVKKDIKAYRPQNGVGAHGLKLGIWFTKHRVVAYRILLGFFIVFDAAVVLFSLWKMGEFLWFDFTRRDRMEAELAYFADHTIIHDHFQPVALKILDIKVFQGGPGQVDALAKIDNPNQDYVAQFDYYFSFGGRDTEMRRGLVLPGVTGVVVELGLKDAEYPGVPKLNLGNLSWQRVSPHEISDPPAWQNDRLNFSVRDLEFLYAGQESGADANIIRFNLINNSAFSYREAEFIVEFKYSGVATGVTRLTLERLMSLESRPVDMRNFVDNLQVNELILYPVIDVYDISEYISPRS